ncbi:PAS domain S-box protein [Myxosarcina sp. GI1]|uniref:PAS domain S-box protein n=1 Tax=Myxosarcina sp. GI1 TaxID=1541065 RepID=UPI000AF69FAC|nr:PAS domain S-box protein [Myxosarcina sp. GI1]
MQHERLPNSYNLEQFIDRPPLVVEPDTLLANVVASIHRQQQNKNNRSDCVLVVTAEQLVGIFTKSDLVRAIATEVELTTTAVAAVMTQPVTTIMRSQCDGIESVLSFVKHHLYSYLPVVDDEQKLIGVLDVCRLLQSLNPVQPESSRNEIDRDNEPNNKNCSECWQPDREWKRFLNINPSMLCIASFDGYFQRLNAAFTKILGFTQDELFAVPFINFVHPEDRTATIAEFESLITGKTTTSFENRYRTKNGDYRWLLWTAEAYGIEKIVCAAAIDITERKKFELALIESESRWQLALKGANDGIWDWNVNTNQVFFSRRWKEMLGYSEAEIGNNLEEWTKRVHPEDLDWVTRVIQDHFAKKIPFYITEHRMLCQDGSYKWILDRGQALWDKAGNVIRMAGSHTDISDRKQAEIELKQERDFSNAVIDTVGALIAILDRLGRIIRFNYTCEQITGYTFAEVEGKQVWDFLIAPEEKSAVRAVFERLLAGQITDRYENFWLAKDGSRHLISWSNTVLFDAEGKIEYIVATGIDVTEQRKVWNQLEHQYQQTRLLAEVTRKIRMSIELDEILQTTVTEVQQLLACDRVLIVKVLPNHTAIPISESLLPELPPMLGYKLADPLLVGEDATLPSKDGANAVGQYLPKYRQGEILAIDDLATASISFDIKQLLAQFEIKAKLVVPILSQNQLKGLLVTHQCYQARQWQQNEIELLIRLADQIGVAISQAQLLNHLEESVAERTIELTTINSLLQEEISERKQTEAALRENQQKLAGILDNADEAIISIDERQQIQMFNQGAEKIFGYLACEIIGQSLDLLLPQAYRQIHRQHVKKFGNSLESARSIDERSSKVFGLRKNGEEFPAEASIAKLSTREGMLFTVMIKDVTERLQAKEKLEASQALLAKAEKIAKIGSWEYDSIARQISWSEELFIILGFSDSRSIPPCTEVISRIHPDDCLLVTNTLQKGHRNGEPWQFNFRWLLPNGKIKYFESRGEPTTDSRGKLLKVWGTIIDISDRIQAEKILQRSEEQLNLITNALPILIAYINDRQCYRYNNRTYETWFGKPRSALLGLHIRELVGEATYQQMLPYIKTALSGKAVTFELQSLGESGNSYWLNNTYIPDFDADGEVKGFFSMTEDISDRKAIEKMKSEFISVASHEMRTPLTSIHGIIKLLCANRLGELSDLGREMATLALRNSERLVRLVNDLLDLERMESGKDRLECQQCNSAELIEQAITTIESMAREHEVVIETNVPSIELWVDRDRILQTTINILSNAIKFSAANSKVLVTVKLQGNEVLFAVKDRGRGIPADKLETIFERFQQVDASDSRQKGGTGLGLAICRHIVEQHGGKIWVKSVYGRGSTFFFTLPQLKNPS